VRFLGIETAAVQPMTTMRLGPSGRAHNANYYYRSLLPERLVITGDAC